MGCPQSKSKNKDISTEQSVQRNIRNDTSRPEVNTATQNESKLNNIENTPDGIPKNSENDQTTSHSNDTAEDINHKSKQSNGSAAKDTNLATETSSEQNVAKFNENSTQIHEGLEMDSVYIPSEPEEENQIDTESAKNKDIYDPGAIDVGDVDIGQTVSEITLENPTVDENDVDRSANLFVVSEKEADKPVTKTEETNVSNVDVNTIDQGYTYTEMSTNWDGPSSVR